MSSQILVAVISGVLVTAIGAGFRALWTRDRVPTAADRHVRRQAYLTAVAKESEKTGVTHLDALVPRLTSARDNRTKLRIQRAWKAIHRRGRDSGQGRVRVLTLDQEECLAGGVELIEDGIEVRVARRELGAEGASYHVFDGIWPQSRVIANPREGGRDRPVRITSAALAYPFRNDFETAWREARPLESVIAQMITDGLPDDATVVDMVAALDKARANLRMSPGSVERVRPHVAWRHSSAIVFVLGLPGAGKSYVRSRLAAHLGTLRIATRSYSDYIYAYRDFLHGLLKLEPSRQSIFRAAVGGAFTVAGERHLRPALHALAQTVRAETKETEVTLVEFARADLLSALQEFDEVRDRSQIIYVTAPKDLRIARVDRRAEQPDTHVTGHTITVRPSDNHRLPSSAERVLYSGDNLSALLRSPHWRDRVIQLDNSVDDNGTQVERQLKAFARRIIEPYGPTTIAA